MTRRAQIGVRVRIMGPINGHFLERFGTVQLREGDTVKTLLKKADRALGVEGRRPFARAFKQAIGPVVLLNGDRLEMPEQAHRPLADGDELSIILTLAGG